MIESEAEKMLAAGVIQFATVERFMGGWCIDFGPDTALHRAGYVPSLERTARAGGGTKTYASLDKAIGACERMGFGKVSVVTDHGAAA